MCRRESTHFRVDSNGELTEFNWAPNIQMSVSETNNEEEVESYVTAYDEFNKMVETFPERVNRIS